MNVALSTVGLKRNLRPDIIGVGANDNTNRIVEIQSLVQDKGRNLRLLLEKEKTMGKYNDTKVDELTMMGMKLIRPDERGMNSE